MDSAVYDFRKTAKQAPLGTILIQRYTIFRITSR